MSKKEFIIRLSAFIILGCIAPFLFIAFRYDLFKKVNEMSLSGWGLIAVVIVFFFARYVLKMIKMGMPYSMFTQCISGALKVILPLLCLYFCVDAIRTSIDLFQQALVFTIICEALAIPVNPLPKWVQQAQITKANTFFGKILEVVKGDSK
jgi:hypothetical protein